ncbi:MAG: hypothetical protein IH957_09390 [Chloroflexi bacterium]|nr:hypothetical protein [Chloroflexota bacterium]
MRVFVAVAVVTMAAFVIYVGTDGFGGDASAGTPDPGAMDAMSIDMDPSAFPANTGTAIGTVQSCARINENNLLDADEDAEDTLEVQVLVDNIPGTNPAIATSFGLDFPAPNQMTVTQIATPFATANGWTIFNVSDGPQSDGDYLHDVVDLPALGTTGSGAISTLTLVTMPSVTTNVHALTFLFSVHIDTEGVDHFPTTTNNAFVAVNTDCPGATPTSTPSPTPTASPTPVPTPTPTPGPSGTGAPTPTPGPSGTVTPTPTPTPTSTGTVTPSPTNGSTPGPTSDPTATPTPGPTGTPPPESKHGDIDCDGDRDAVDALVILRFVGGFSDELVACAQPAGAFSGEAVQGDVDCDDDVDAVDALALLRFVAGFLDELTEC